MWRTEDCRELTASSINHNTNIQLFFEIIKFWSNFFQKSVIFCWTKWNRTTDFPRFTGGTLPTELLSYGQSLSMFICTRFIIIDCFAWLRLRESDPVSRGYEPLMIFSVSFLIHHMRSTPPRYNFQNVKEIKKYSYTLASYIGHFQPSTFAIFHSPIHEKCSCRPNILGNLLYMVSKY